MRSSLGVSGYSVNVRSSDDATVGFEVLAAAVKKPSKSPLVPAHEVEVVALRQDKEGFAALRQLLAA